MLMLCRRATHVCFFYIHVLLILMPVLGFLTFIHYYQATYFSPTSGLIEAEAGEKKSFISFFFSFKATAGRGRHFSVGELKLNYKQLRV